MNEMQTGGVIAILSALPELCLGLALLMGRWQPASLANARDPNRARFATGLYCTMIGAMVALLGIGLLLTEAIVPYAVISIVTLSLLGLIPLLHATRTRP